MILVASRLWQTPVPIFTAKLCSKMASSSACSHWTVIGISSPLNGPLTTRLTLHLWPRDFSRLISSSTTGLTLRRCRRPFSPSARRANRTNRCSRLNPACSKASLSASRHRYQIQGRAVDRPFVCAPTAIPIPCPLLPSIHLLKHEKKLSLFHLMSLCQRSL